MIRKAILTLFVAINLVAHGMPAASAEPVTIGYQLVFNPWKVAIALGKFEKATGREINWVRFNSGGDVITALASEDVDIALAGSSPIAAGVSQGVDIELFWIAEDIAAAEAMVARNGSGIDSNNPVSLKGKRFGVPFVSTTHFHTLFALETWGIRPDEVTLLNMQPNEIVAAWERGDIDAAFVWDPALGRLKQSGDVIITSGELSAMGKATFDGMVARRAFAKANPDFMARFVKVMAEADADYRDRPEMFSSSSDAAKAIVSLVGGNPEDVPDVLQLYRFPTLEEQVSERWLGGDARGGAAKALFYTSEFLKQEGKIDQVLPEYWAVVTPDYAKAAMKM